MSGKYKRPSSARRNIKQESFSPYVSISRLRQIQSLLSDNDSNTDAPDALICIAGIDARYNEGMQELVNYLLFGFFEVRKQEIERSGFEEEVVEDLMFLIKRNSVDVYCNPINYMYFLPYISHWRNLHVHCMKDDDYEDDEKAEEFKIWSFLRMTQGCQKIAVPFSSTTHQQKFDIMAVEKWPIVQAFALEEIGGGGFFTMKYEVEDLSESLMSVYQLLDPVSVEGIVTEQLPLFERQWESMLSVIDSESSKSAKDVTSKTILEPLKTFYQHGRINSGKGARKIQSHREPFVLVGKETRREELEVAGGMVTNTRQTSSSQSETPLHMICHCVSPKSALCCTRTYFFSNGVLPHPVLSSTGADHCLPDKSDVKVLQSVYAACIDGVLAGITTYSTTLSAKQAEIEAKGALLRRLEESRLPLSIDHISPLKNIDFKLEAYDSQNRLVSPLSSPCSRLMLKFCSLSVYDIPSLQNRGQACGSVSFGETFLNSVLNIELSDGSRQVDGEFSVLTSVIPRVITWQRSAAECLVYSQIEQVLGSESGEAEVFGRQILTGENIQYITEDQGSALIENGDLYFYEFGLVYTHPHHGTVVLPKAEMTSLHIYDGNSPSVVTLIVVAYQEHISDYLPLHMRSAFNRFILVFEPRSKANKQLFSQVLPVWKEPEQKPELQWLEELPEELAQLHKELQNAFKLKSIPAGGLSPKKRAMGRVEGLERLVPHFESSSVGEESIPRKYTELLAGRPWDEGSFSDNQEVVVTIIGGLPGSGKLELCECLRKLGKQDSRWTVIRPGTDAEEKFDKEMVVSHLRSTYLAYKNNRASSGRMRAILVTPGFTDTADVIQTIISQKDGDLGRHLKIGAVTVCVDPQTAYMSDRYSFPKLLDQCAQGWVNNIVFMTSPDAKESHQLELEFVQNTVRAVNSDVALMLSVRGEVTRAPDLDRILSHSAFNTQEALKSRFLSSPGWWKGSFNTGPSFPEMEQLFLRFSQPLERSRLNTRLKDLKTNLKKHPFHGNVYFVKGKVMFSESQQVHEFHYSVLSGCEMTTSACSVQQNGDHADQPYTVVFIGIGLAESRLRDWLRASAKQKPQKKIHRTRKNLNRVEINRIHKEHHLEPLPEGWFYNGAKYVSLAGDKSDYHPNLDTFLDTYLEKVNKDVDVYNAKIDSQEFCDLFS